MNSNNVTVTDGRLKKSLKDNIEPIMLPKVERTITKEVNNSKIRTGVITKFYPYLDKAEVKLDNVNKKVLCKILHRYGGDIIDFYTPLKYKQIFDEKLKEPAIIPKSKQHVCVISVHDSDSKEHLILGYYQNEDIVGFNPAAPGNVKFMSLLETNQFWIKFGIDGLDYRLPSSPKILAGDLDENMESINYSNAENVYTKEEVYTKTEVDKMLEDLKKELMGDTNNDAAG